MERAFEQENLGMFSSSATASLLRLIKVKLNQKVMLALLMLIRWLPFSLYLLYYETRETKSFCLLSSSCVS